MHPQSNAPAGYPDVSPEGYPLFYPLDGNGQPAGEARLVYANQTFGSVAELEDHKRRRPLRDEALERWRRAWLADEYHMGPIPAAHMVGNYTMFYLRIKADAYKLAQKGDLFEKVLRGSNPEIARVKQWAAVVPSDFALDSPLLDRSLMAIIDNIAAA